MNKWLKEAEAAAADYAAGNRRGEYPVRPEVGLCQKAARCLWEAVMGKPMPWRGSTATKSMRLAEQQDRAITGDEVNAYHRAVGTGQLVPGCCLYFGGNRGMGHVVVVVRVVGDPGLSLNVVRVFENTSAKRGGAGPGTLITTLDKVCGTQGSDRILAVVPPGR